MWSSEVYNDDVPYWIDLPWEQALLEKERKGMLLIPYNYDCNDGKFHMSPGFGSSVAETYEQYLKNTFDCLYREGGKLMNIPLHTRIIGKPGRSEALFLTNFHIHVQFHEELHAHQCSLKEHAIILDICNRNSPLPLSNFCCSHT